MESFGQEGNWVGDPDATADDLELEGYPTPSQGGYDRLYNYDEPPAPPEPPSIFDNGFLELPNTANVTAAEAYAQGAQAGADAARTADGAFSGIDIVNVERQVATSGIVESITAEDMFNDVLIVVGEFGKLIKTYGLNQISGYALELIQPEFIAIFVAVSLVKWLTSFNSKDPCGASDGYTTDLTPKLKHGSVDPLQWDMDPKDADLSNYPPANYGYPKGWPTTAEFHVMQEPCGWNVEFQIWTNDGMRGGNPIGVRDLAYGPKQESDGHSTAFTGTFVEYQLIWARNNSGVLAIPAKLKTTGLIGTYIYDFGEVWIVDDVVIDGPTYDVAVDPNAQKSPEGDQYNVLTVVDTRQYQVSYNNFTPSPAGPNAGATSSTVAYDVEQGPCSAWSFTCMHVQAHWVQAITPIPPNSSPSNPYAITGNKKSRRSHTAPPATLPSKFTNKPIPPLVGEPVPYCNPAYDARCSSFDKANMLFPDWTATFF